MLKQKKYDWKDSNMALFGSDLEKNIKKAAAEGEAQWRGVGHKVEQFATRTRCASSC